MAARSGMNQILREPVLEEARNPALLVAGNPARLVESLELRYRIQASQRRTTMDPVPGPTYAPVLSAVSVLSPFRLRPVYCEGLSESAAPGGAE
jgi:hypothetical protein